MNEAAVTRERREIERVFIHNWKGRGKVILRNDKDQVMLNANAGERLAARTPK